MLLAGANTLIYNPPKHLGLLSIPVAFCFGGVGVWGCQAEAGGWIPMTPGCNASSPSTLALSEHPRPEHKLLRGGRRN